MRLRKPNLKKSNFTIEKQRGISKKLEGEAKKEKNKHK